MRIGGVVAEEGGSLTYNAYGDSGNQALTTTTLLGSLGPFGPGGFSGEAATQNLGLLGPQYSITQEIILTHSAGAASSFNAEFQIPDGGGSLSLLGFGMSALTGFAWGRERKR